VLKQLDSQLLSMFVNCCTHGIASPGTVPGQKRKSDTRGADVTSSTPAFVLGGGVNALAVVRSLGRHKIPVALFSNDANDLARRSRYVTSFRQAPDSDEELLQVLLEAGAESGAQPVIFFTSDKFLKFLSSHRRPLSDSFRLIISDETAVSTVLSKGKFNEFTEVEAFPAPRGLVLNSGTGGTDQAEALTYPVIAKPLLSYEWRSRAFREKFGQSKAMLFETPAALHHILPSLLEHTSDLLLQEAIVGRDDAHFSVLIYRSPRFGEVFRLCVNKERVWPIRNGAGSFSRVFPDSRMEKIGTELLEKLGWVGMASVCFKVDSGTGRPIIHEVNGRLPQIHGIAQAAGIDLPFLMYVDAMGKELPTVPAPTEAATYRIFSMDCAALLAYRRAGDLTRSEVLRRAIQADSIAEFACDDWRPSLGVIRQGLSNLVRGLL
jgi:D-aspartate ligase